MARSARIVLPGCPHHVTHRGNRGDDVFFRDEDRWLYLQWLGKYANKSGLAIWAYCLMTNHVHLIVVPEREDSLGTTIGQTHMRYSRWINKRMGWSGHLWANRFFSTPLDESHLWAAVKYVECNPVRAGLVRRAEEYEWSSVRAHAFGDSDPVLSPTRPFPARERIGDWATWLAEGLDAEMQERLRQCTNTGRPCGSKGFIDQIEQRLGRSLRLGKPGRKARGDPTA